MEHYKRFAVYFAPDAGPFAERAAAWLGREAKDACDVAHPDLGVPLAEITKTPRKYAFHATVKPPFRLASGRTASGLHLDMGLLARRLEPVVLEGLELSQIAGFLALTPVGDNAAVNAMAAEVVAALDHLRAPSSAAEIAKRKPESLTHRQRHLLGEWGYPYVMEEFRFHMTLTDRLPPDLGPAYRQAAEGWFAPVLPKPLTIDSLCLFGEREDGAFELIHRYNLCN